MVAGRATFVLDGEEKDVPAGSRRLPPRPEGEALRARGGAEHDRARRRRQARVHETSAWEYFFAAYAVVDEDPDRAIAEIEAGLAEKPDHPGLHFHLACIYTRAGRLDEAGTALDRALELDPKLQKWAGEDEDLRRLSRNEDLSEASSRESARRRRKA